MAHGNQFLTFDAESKFAKIQNSHVKGVWVGRLVETNFQLLMLSSNLLKSKIPMSSEGGLMETNFQLLMLSSNLLKSILFGCITSDNLLINCYNL